MKVVKREVMRVVERPKESSTKSKESIYKDEECIICREEYGPENPARFLSCGHKFHNDCIDNVV